MANMMKAAVIEAPEKLVVKDMPVPEISDDEVLIKVKYTGICGTDWSIYTGKYSADKLPLIAGHEFSGVIEAVGKNAKDLKEGDPVTADINMSCGTCYYCKRGLTLMCPEFTQIGIHTHGTYAEYVKAPWKLVHKLPKDLNFLTGAFIEPVSCVVHSAKAMDLPLGSSVAILGASLGILHAAVARHRGAAPIIVIGRNKRKLKIAEEMGADITISLEDNVDPVAEVKKLTGGRGADYVIEAVGTVPTYEQAFQMSRPGGTIAAFGIAGDQDVMKLKPFDMVLGERSFVGSCAGFGMDWEDSIVLLEHGRIKPEPLFSMVFPLDETEAALKELRENPDMIKVFVSPEATKREKL
ncbi:MAG: zinc-dependent alcohol dehydrogenase [Spirochaetia bacterium]